MVRDKVMWDGFCPVFVVGEVCGENFVFVFGCVLFVYINVC